MSRGGEWLWLPVMGALLSVTIHAQEAPPAAATGDGYWRHEGETLHRDFKNIDTTCATVKTDWTTTTFADKLRNIISCTGSVQGNSLVFDFGQAPANNQIGLGLALTDGDPLKFKDAKGRLRDLDVIWK
jgi:hypothetical protein